ncbi:LysR family transcriptional regulator [Ideonella margarita]|jgi:DNA-binding transcriptional LysR family regulator|uniref:LysR family transcriptional regulator n=1 Tax=Ideonella margarita TaxID=2984191 RepID=A0ABU9C621_9BURK
MDSLRAMRVFARVIDEGSFAGAARALDLAPAVVTRLVADLEEHLGARLMNRTTRRISLTEIGESYLERVRQILADIDDAEAMANASVSDPKGHVRMLMPPAVAVHQLAKHLPRFHAMYPQVTLEIVANGPVETVDDGFDLTIALVRKPLEGNFIARRLARTEVISCASPEYLDKHGRPKHPEDLARYDVLIPPISELQRGITFYRGTDPENPTDSFHAVPRRGVLSTINVDANYAAALSGLGVAGLPSFVIEDALMEHALERVLPEWRLFSSTLWACMPTRQHVPARTRAMLDFLVQVFGGEDRDPWLAAAGCETPCASLLANCAPASESLADGRAVPQKV